MNKNKSVLNVMLIGACLLPSCNVLQIMLKQHPRNRQDCIKPGKVSVCHKYVPKFKKCILCIYLLLFMYTVTKYQGCSNHLDFNLLRKYTFQHQSDKKTGHGNQN